MKGIAEQQALAKLEWEAASEKLGNALVPPNPGLPIASRDDIRECFELLQTRLDALRALYDAAADGAQDEDEDADPVG